MNSESIPSRRERRGPWHAQGVLIREAAVGGGDVGAVIALAKAAKSTVGFLPDSAFRDRAQSGTLLVAVADDHVVGYLLHDLPRDEIKVVQLVVDPTHRGQGIARRLLDEVGIRHQARRGVSLSCRNDYPAHALWPSLGFAPMGERVGRSVDGKPLTRWWKSFGHADLLTLLDEADDRPLAVLDSCVFFDVVADDPPLAAEQLRSDWLTEHVRIAISSEVNVEISRGKDRVRRDRQYLAAQALPLVDPTEHRWRPICEAIQELQPNAGQSDDSDLRQVARAVASGAKWLISTDSGLRARYAEVSELLSNLQIISPAEFVRSVDELARGEAYRPVDLAGTAVTSREADSNSIAQLAARFVNHAHGETIGQLRGLIRGLAVSPRSNRLRIIDVGGVPRALLAMRAADDALEASIVRVVGGRSAGVLARHLLAFLRQESEEVGQAVVRITDAEMSPAVREQLSVEGFVAVEPGAVAVVLRGAGTMSDLAATVNGLPLTDAERSGMEPLIDHGGAVASASRAEAWFSPYRVLGAAIPTFVVPIRAAWAAPLFDVNLANAQLFPRDWELGLRRELAYYRSPRNGGAIEAPGRILWYVAGSQQDYGVRSIRAISSLNEVVSRPVDQLWHRFRRLGVYERSDIDAAAAEGRAMALRFSNTELLEYPVSLDDYREIATGDSRSSSVVLQSPRRVSERVFVEILSRGRRQ